MKKDRKSLTKAAWGIVGKYVVPSAEDFKYNYDEALGGVVITRYNGEATAICVPAEIDGEPVVKVSFSDHFGITDDRVTHIELPDGITNIEDFAFMSFTSLREITIPDSVTSIGKWAVNECISLKNLTIPDNAEIWGSAFHGCDGLTVTYKGQEYTSTNDPNDWWR